MFGNFFSRFRGNQHGNHFGGGGSTGRDALGSEGGVSIYSAAAGASTGTGNVTSITVPMLRSGPHRRVDVVTTVVSNTIDHPVPSASSLSPQIVDVLGAVNGTGGATSNSSASAQQNVNNRQKIVPTTTRVTSSISAIQQGVPVTITLSHKLGEQNFKTPNTLTLPFTPNLFGMMSYVQALKDIKRSYHDQEKERKIVFHNKDGGDLMTRVLRTLIQKVVNKYQKQTEILKLKIIKRQDKLQKFLQLPMVAQVIAMDQARQVSRGGVAVGQPVSLGKGGAGVVVQTSTHIGPISPLGKPAHSIVNSFLI